MRGIVKRPMRWASAPRCWRRPGRTPPVMPFASRVAVCLAEAFAGADAYSADPSIIFFNPAGMSALDGTRASAVVNYIHPKNEFDDDGSTSLIPSAPRMAAMPVRMRLSPPSTA